MEFKEFLKSKLKALRIDEKVYFPYVLSVLEDDLDDDEKKEMISEIIGSLIETDTASHSEEIFKRWKMALPNSITTEVVPQAPPQSIDIAELLKTQTNISIQASGRRRPELTEEERRIKQQILASYSQTDEPEEDEEAEAAKSDEDVEKNTNKSDVQKLAKEKREQAKLDSSEKKKKDQEDRLKQKNLKESKKASRQSAAVKGERRR